MTKLPRISGLALLVSVCTLLACQTGDLSAPPRAASVSVSASRGQPPRGMANAGGEGREFFASKCDARRPVSNSGVFGPSGGTLFFGDSKLVIPGGALRDTVTITATIPDSASSRVEFAPHGLVFDKAAGLLLGTTGCVLDPTQAPSVVYIGADGQVLEWIDVVWDPHWKTFAAPIWHFSGYGVAF